MVRLLEPVLPAPLVELLSLLPQAATPKARPTARQLEAATERTRKIPSSGNGHQKCRGPYTQDPTWCNARTIKPSLSLPVARKVGRQDVHRGAQHDDHDRDHEGVERLDVDRPEDDPHDEAKDGCEDEAHARGQPIAARRRSPRQARG